jgi:hypothetical protein
MSLRPIAFTAGLALTAAVVLTGCSGKSATSIIEKAIPGHSDGSGAMDADFIGSGFKAIDNKVGASQYGVIMVMISPQRVAMRVVDPKKPANVDEYDYRRDSGSVGDPTPVDISGSEPGALEENTFQRADLQPAVIAQAVTDAPKASGIDEATAQSVTITYPLVANQGDQPYIQVDVKGPRGTGFPRYSLQGNPLPKK